MATNGDITFYGYGPFEDERIINKNPKENLRFAKFVITLTFFNSANEHLVQTSLYWEKIIKKYHVIVMSTVIS